MTTILNCTAASITEAYMKIYFTIYFKVYQLIENNCDDFATDPTLWFSHGSFDWLS